MNDDPLPVKAELPSWFDPDFYLVTYPEVRESGIDPWVHFLAHGYAEGRRPSATHEVPNAKKTDVSARPAWFDKQFYLRTYADVRESGMDPWRHFIDHGYLEGRQPSDKGAHPDWFDPDYYSKRYPEVPEAGIAPWVHFLKFGYTEGRRPSARHIAYDFDGLTTQHNSDFMREPAFIRAYNRGSQAARGIDHQWYWRFHVGLWCLRTAIRLPGDFVEFGVNYGMLASGGMLDLDWNQHNKHFYLFESFGGMKPDHVDTAVEGRAHLDSYNRVALSNGFYATNPEEVRANFAEFHNIHLIVGFVPDTLDQLAAREVAFVHVDMNNPVPEVLALRFVWERIVPGGLVLLDDYAQKGFELQKRAMDDLSREIGFDILSLPTGQGLIIKT